MMSTLLARLIAETVVNEGCQSRAAAATQKDVVPEDNPKRSLNENGAPEALDLINEAGPHHRMCSLQEG